MANEVFPYLVPGADSVRLGPWQLLLGDHWQELPARLPDWDSNTDLILARNVDINLGKVLHECRLSTDAGLVLTTSWTSSSSTMTHAVAPIPVSDRMPSVLEARLAGDRLGGVVTVRTTLTLASPPVLASPGVASEPGSVLFDDRFTTGLEPTEPPFPMHETDFAKTALDPQASWHLVTTSDMFAPFLGSFLLLLNSRDTELIRALARGRKDKRQELLVDQLEHEVGALMLELAAYHQDELMEQDPWPAGSVGDVLSRMLAGASGLGTLQPSVGSHDLAETRTRLIGAARSAGYGRQFT